MTAWWKRLGTGGRFVTAIVAVVVAINVAFVALDGIIGSGPGGPASSPTATSDHGLGAYAELLDDGERNVSVRRDELGPGDLAPSATAVVADPIRLSAADATELRAFVAGGGRLILTGPATAEIVTGLTGQPVNITSVTPLSRLDVWVPGDLTGAARSIAGDDGRRWTDTGGLLPIIGADGRAQAITASVGDAGGRIIALTSTAPLQNSRLATADNAALGLGLAGAGRDVVFVDRTAAPSGSGLSALPTSWKWTAAGMAIAAVAFLWSVGTRFGPPEPAERNLRPARSEHVEAVAASMSRAAGTRRRPRLDPHLEPSDRPEAEEPSQETTP